MASRPSSFSITPASLGFGAYVNIVDAVATKAAAREFWDAYHVPERKSRKSFF